MNIIHNELRNMMSDINKSLQIRQVNPFLKWAGGKGRLIEQYQAFLPKTLKGRDYVEPFVGNERVEIRAYPDTQ